MYLVVGLVAVMLVLRVFTSIPELDITTWFQHNTSLVCMLEMITIFLIITI